MGKAIKGIFGGAKSADLSQPIANWEDLKKYLPEMSDQELSLLLNESMGEYNPEMESYIDAGESSLSGIEQDPRLRNVQLQALDYLSEVGQTGLTAADRAALNEIRRSAQNEAQAQQNQVVQSMAQRGIGGSGVELASRLNAAQSVGDRMSRESDALARQAQERAMNAILQQSQLAGNMDSADFNRAAQIAQAQDAMNKFNTQNQQSLQQRNVSARNQAQAQNLQERQRIADSNVALKNQQQQYNKNLGQQNFQNRLAITQGQAGLQASQQQGNAAAHNQQMQGAMQLMGTGASSAAMLLSDETKKKDIKKVSSELRKLLDNLDSYTYEYKEESDGEGKRAGVMAQDLEKAGPLGESMVKNTPNGKMVDYGQGMSTILATLVDMNKRIKDIEGKKK